MSTREVVEELFRRMGSGRPEEVASLYAPQVDWQLNWPAHEISRGVPWIRDRATRDDVGQHFSEIARYNEPEPPGTSVRQVLVDGPDAVVLGTIRLRASSTGLPYTAHFALHLTVERGLIVRHHVYEDSLSVALAWHGAEVTFAR